VTPLYSTMIKLIASDILAMRARLRLTVLSEAGPRRFTIPAGATVLIGRTDASEIDLADASVSRRHALLHAGPTPLLEDLGSYNGTFVQGQRIAAGDRVALIPGEPFEIGSVVCVIHAPGTDAEW